MKFGLDNKDIGAVIENFKQKDKAIAQKLSNMTIESQFWKKFSIMCKAKLNLQNLRKWSRNNSKQKLGHRKVSEVLDRALTEQ